MPMLILVVAVAVLAFGGARPSSAANQLVTSTADSGAGSLRQACLDAGDGDTVFFSAAGMSIVLTNGQIGIAQGITVLGTNITVDAGGVSRAFYVNAGAADNVSLTGLIVTNGFIAPPGIGGGIYADACGRLSMTGCTVVDCVATNGGGLAADEGIAISNCTFAGNLALAQGGGIFQSSSESVRIDGGVFASNTAEVRGGSTYRGGGAVCLGYHTTIRATIQGGTVFTNNQALGYHGGAVFVGGGANNNAVSIDGAVFVDNRNTLGMGGAVYGAGVTLTGCSLRRNQGRIGGGAIASAGNLTVIGCEFTENSTVASAGHTSFGGAIGLRGALPTVVSNCVFRGNSDATIGGGAIGTYADNTRLSCYSSVFEGNRGPDGGAIRTQLPTELYSCTFITNVCADDGGALMVAGATGLVVNCTFSGNIATDDGGAICGEDRYAGVGLTNHQPRVLVYNSTLYTNRGDCGGIHINRTAATPRLCAIYSSIVAGNRDGAANDDLEGDFLDAEHCLIGESPAAGYTVGGSTTGTSNGQDPTLAGLADNGGPALPAGALLTHALLPRSPAIDQGANPRSMLFDQRGPVHPRAQGHGPDIGAFESASSSKASWIMMR